MIKEMSIVLFVAAIMLLGASVANAEIVVVDFDDLSYDTNLSGTTYAGLTWEWGSEVYDEYGEPHSGRWDVPPDDVPTYPYSEPYCVINAWGASLMGIGFPETVDVLGAYFAGVTSSGYWWTTGVRVHGYLGETEVAATDWFNDIDMTPSWFAMNLNNVDRIVIESVPVVSGSGFYGMDDLTYTPEPGTISLLALGGLALLRKRKA